MPACWRACQHAGERVLMRSKPDLNPICRWHASWTAGASAGQRSFRAASLCAGCACTPQRSVTARGLSRLRACGGRADDQRGGQPHDSG
eukprot:354510-Chlamydomonas_euryale.AAC.5